jgi:hypothetical protein
MHLKLFSFLINFFLLIKKKKNVFHTALASKVILNVFLKFLLCVCVCVQVR